MKPTKLYYFNAIAFVFILGTFIHCELRKGSDNQCSIYLVLACLNIPFIIYGIKNDFFPHK